MAGKTWSEIGYKNLPPCKAEGGSFMSSKSYEREFNHPYNQPNRQNIPHLALRPTRINIPAYTSFAVPFWWMLRNTQVELREQYPNIPPDETPPFPSSWVYSKETQNALLKEFFEPIKENQSLVVYYAKGVNPVDEDTKRLIVGIGMLKKKSKILEYTTTSDYTYPIWDRMIEHGIRPDDAKSEGVLLPYHEYLELPEDFVLRTADGKKTKYELLDEIKLTLQQTAGREEIVGEFAYGSEWVSDSTILVVLGKLRSIIERIKEHGIAGGKWNEHLIWVDRQIGAVKANMGPFPSFSNALLALGFQYANVFEYDIRSKNILGIKDDPWDIWEKVVYGEINLSSSAYKGDLPQFRDVWLNETNERKELLKLLSRFEIDDKQIKNWYDPIARKKMGLSISDKDIIDNPYVISEDDLGDAEHFPIAVETIDNGIFEDRAIQGENVPLPPILVSSPLDERRIRALVISILKKSALEGDTLLSINEIVERINLLNLQRTTVLPPNYIHSKIEFISKKVFHLKSEEFDALQLKKYEEIESFFRKIIIARTQRELNPLDEDWATLIKKTINDNGITYDDTNIKHTAALQDQVNALLRITGRKLSVLHGPAGTGKTTVMGALFGCKVLQAEGILMLAPTGKARVRLGKIAGGQAYTIAQFLTRLKRFDWLRMQPLFYGKEKYKGEQNVIIDECSMLTEADLYALFQAIDLGHVKRIILVGDPYQLPPIGAGRPFADVCAYLETLSVNDQNYSSANALARLSEVVRTVSGNDSDCLTLASWYSGMKPNKNADEIFSKIGDNTALNDLTIECWDNEEELFEKLSNAICKELGLKNNKDYASLNSFLGIGEKNIDTSKIEAFQLLTPVKAPYWGAFNLNRVFQEQFRGGLKGAVSIGDYKIGHLDKVMQTRNEYKQGFPGNEKFQLSNGQLGLVKDITKGFANVVFSGIDNKVTFGYRSQGQVEADDGNIELAYAITVHKSQGSDFDKVFLIVPKSGRVISRELIYTALTRAKKKLVLLVGGDRPHWIFSLSKPQYSETAKRNTHLFKPCIRDAKAAIPFAEGLIHKTKKEGLLVRSKSEVIIANELVYRGIPFEYEREYSGTSGSKRIPDFTFIDAAGDLIILEHLGMMSIPSYRQDWYKKLKYYEQNGFKLGENLFTTTESDKGGIDSKEIEKVVETIEKLL